MKRDAGFTLVELMVALLLGAIGLLGTLAVQQAVVGASKSANDAAVALRLTSQKIEEFNSYRTTGDPAANAANVDQLAALVSESWSNPQYLNAEGFILAGATATTPEYRWIRRWRISNGGVGLPYIISSVVTYTFENGDPKTVRLDIERRKTW
jgi:prepilin-type N-terminal cleavage/methylation domain-containing protein